MKSGTMVGCREDMQRASGRGKGANSADSQCARLRNLGRSLFEKPQAIIIVVIVMAALWPFYRKFFINEWRERIAYGLPVVFIPDCPTTFSQFKCGDRYTVLSASKGITSGAVAFARMTSRKERNPAVSTLMPGISRDPGDISASKVSGFIIPGGDE